MKKAKGVAVEAVSPGGAAQRAGIREGDVLIELNGRQVNDIIDYMFALEGPVSSLTLRRGDGEVKAELSLKEGEEAGLRLRHFTIRTCRNKCKFCFVSQLPKGLRRPLYVKDEDYRSSFLYGNYVTLTNLSAGDKKRILEQRLSPLYVSVHSTDRELRNSMLGNPDAPDVMQEMKAFARGGIRLHTQIVLCPGLNDEEALNKTILDLGSLYPAVQSVAVVPVGLTSHTKTPLAPVDRVAANAALAAIDGFREKFRESFGDPIVQGSDELYIKAGRPFPPLSEYGELPQIENGVGMTPLFLSKAKGARLPGNVRKEKYIAFTGTSFYPILKKFIDRLNRQGAEIITIKLVQVENRLFGPAVTVTGLLTGRDIIEALKGHIATGKYGALLMPGCVLRDAGDVLLDDVTPSAVEDALGIKVIIIEPTPGGLMEALKA